jgi:hypothetical protein
MRRGASFHRLVNQHMLGVDPERLGRQAAGDTELAAWWEDHLNHLPSLTGTKHAEAVLSAPLAGSRIVARYDLVAVGPDGRVTIVDWKTSTTPGSRSYLASRLQTRVYPCLLVWAGAALNADRDVDPDEVQMIYWYAPEPQSPVIFPYNVRQFEDDSLYLEGLIAEILDRAEDSFARTERQERCRYCRYRSLCDRGTEAGPLAALEGDLKDEAGLDLDLDFEQIAEISY